MFSACYQAAAAAEEERWDSEEWYVGPTWPFFLLVLVVVVVVTTRSQRGHMERVEAGRGSHVWGERTVGGATLIALSSSTSL